MTAATSPADIRRFAEQPWPFYEQDDRVIQEMSWRLFFQ